jgi:hypothetical protein
VRSRKAKVGLVFRNRIFMHSKFLHLKKTNKNKKYSMTEFKKTLKKLEEKNEEFR